MSMTKDAELHLVVGKRGSGKSTLTKKLIRDYPRAVIFDPRAEYSRGVQVSTLKGVRDAMVRKWSRGFEIAYVPPAGQEAEALHSLCCFLRRAQGPYEAGSDPTKMLLVVEEMNLSYPVTKLPNQLYGMDQAINQGRHWGLEIIGVTQRPALVGMNFRDQVSTTYLFALEDEEAVKAMARKFGKPYEATIRGLPKFHCLMRKDGKVSGFKTSKTGKMTPISIRT